MRIKKTNDQLQKEGAEFKLKRKLMGLKQKDIDIEYKISQGALSKMESGRENLGWRLDALRDKYKRWKIQEIKRITKHIKYLNSI